MEPATRLLTIATPASRLFQPIVSAVSVQAHRRSLDRSGVGKDQKSRVHRCRPEVGAGKILRLVLIEQERAQAGVTPA
jgi:hypothetical protein